MQQVAALQAQGTGAPCAARCRLIPSPQLLPGRGCNRRPCQRGWPSMARRLRRASAAAGESALPADTPVVAVEGDIVAIHWDCLDSETGELLESSRPTDDPATFEVGAGDVVGNNLFQAFDEAVRGLAVGDKARIKAEGGEWKQELLFVVPRDHEEMVRLENRYKNVGGLSPSQVVQLSNGGMALVLEVDDEKVVLDANSALAGKALTFELELVGIQRES